MSQGQQKKALPDVTEWSLMEATFQKLADRCTRGYRDETNPNSLRWKLYGSAEAYSLVAMLCRDVASQVSIGKSPPKNLGLLEQMYKMMIDMSRQSDD